MDEQWRGETETASESASATKPALGGRLPWWVSVVTLLAGLWLGLVAPEPTDSGVELASGESVSPTPRRISARSPRPTPSATPTPSPTHSLSPEVLRELSETAFASIFNDGREELAAAIESDVVQVESVDRLVLDQETDTLHVSASSGFSTEELLRDGVWAVARIFSPLYGVDSAYRPSLAIALEGVRYHCNGDFMARLASRQASRSDFEQECQIR